jgi:regulator of protease activity HflC (stomatin/prohibitin superfamily)
MKENSDGPGYARAFVEFQGRTIRMDIPMIIGIVAAATGLLTSFRILWEYERGVVFRLGKLTRAKGPGLIFLVPYGLERMKRMDLRIVALDIAPQDTITKDNVSVTVNAVVYFKVTNPAKAVVEIEDYYFATSQLAQTTLRSVIGQSELDELLAERERINEIVRDIIDEGTDPWGIAVTGVEIKDIDLPKEMKRAMAKQAEAERERRGKVIAAAGEFQASRKLADAAAILQEYPMALQLRYLQTAVEIAAENNSTTVFPIPMELMSVASGGEGKSVAPAGAEGMPALLTEGTTGQLLADAVRRIADSGMEQEQARVATERGAGEEGEA